MLDLIQRLGDAHPQRGLYLHEDFVSSASFVPFGEFPGRVAACAKHFREQGLAAGARVLLPFETDERLLFAFLGLMELGAVPLSVKPYILSTPKQGYREFLARLAHLHGVEWILDAPSLKGLDLPFRRMPLPPFGLCSSNVGLRHVSAEELAFVQFSSGSTSFPKGVPVTQRNLALNMKMIAEHDGRNSHSRALSWLPLYHDMGLVGALTCLYSGTDLYLTQPASFLMDPLGWLEFISSRRITLSAIPNFAIDYTLKHLREMEPDTLDHLDLSALRAVYLGSEPINIANLERFTDLLAPRGLQRTALLPCYGMAEAVLMVSCVSSQDGWRLHPGPNGRTAISVGRPHREFAVRVRTDDGRDCGPCELGEIELCGGTLAGEYYGGAVQLRGEDGFYATGDQGFVEGGELFITGRVNDRIKVNGQSFFSGDFEQAVERLPFIRSGRSVVLQVEGRVVVLAEVNRPSALQARAQSQQQVSEAILQGVGVAVAPQDVLFLRYGQIRKTSSGKLQRRAMAEAYQMGQLRLAGPTQLRIDLLRVRSQRLFLGLKLAAQKRGRSLREAITRAAFGLAMPTGLRRPRS